jgi:hypothetical protein
LKLFLKLCILFAPVLFALGYVEHELGSVPNGYSMKRERVERRIPEIKILITGSSHSFYAIKPRALNQNAFSLAYISQDLFYDTRLLLKYVPRAPKLELVIIPISYFSLESKLRDTIEKWRCPFYHKFYGFPAAEPLDVKNYSLIALYGASETQSLIFRRFRSRNTELIDDDGGPPEGFRNSENSDLSSEAALARHHSSMRPALVQENIDYLNEAVQVLKSRSVGVVFVTTPVYKSYYSHLNPAAYARMQDAIRSMSEQNGIQYHNYMEDLRFDESDFFDCDHLNASGMAKFTKILKNEIVDPSIASGTIVKEPNSRLGRRKAGNLEATP